MASLSVTCPPCGQVLTADTEDELVRIVQEHAGTEHGHTLSDADVRKAIQTQPAEQAQS